MKPQELTANQAAIVDAIATGRTIKEVAEFLGKAPQTIFNTLALIYEKIGVPHNLSALAVWRVCTENHIEIPEFIRRAGALALLLIFSTSIIGNDDTYMRARRCRRNEMSVQITLEDTEV